MDPLTSFKLLNTRSQVLIYNRIKKGTCNICMKKFSIHDISNKTCYFNNIRSGKEFNLKKCIKENNIKLSIRGNYLCIRKVDSGDEYMYLLRYKQSRAICKEVKNFIDYINKHHKKIDMIRFVINNYTAEFYGFNKYNYKIFDFKSNKYNSLFDNVEKTKVFTSQYYNSFSFIPTRSLRENLIVYFTLTKGNNAKLFKNISHVRCKKCDVYVSKHHEECEKCGQSCFIPKRRSTRGEHRICISCSIHERFAILFNDKPSIVFGYKYLNIKKVNMTAVYDETNELEIRRNEEVYNSIVGFSNLSLPELIEKVEKYTNNYFLLNHLRNMEHKYNSGLLKPMKENYMCSRAMLPDPFYNKLYDFGRKYCILRDNSVDYLDFSYY